MQPHKKILFSIVLILLSAKIFAGGTISVDARFDSAQILIGDQMYLNMVVTQPVGVKVMFPVFTDSIVSKIEVLSSLPADTTHIDANNIKVTKKYLVTCFDSGLYQTQPLKFAFFNGTTTDTLVSAPIMLAVNTLQVKDPSKIADIKGVIEIPLTLKEILAYTGIGLAILLAILLIAYVIWRWKTHKPILGIFAKPAEPAHVIALRELERIQREKLWQRGFIKEYYSGITDAVRTYIEARFEVPAMESTSEEIISRLKTIDVIEKSLITKLTEMFSLADLVKFAKMEPAPNENENIWAVAYDFVKNTIPVVATEPSVNEKKEEPEGKDVK
ncbi:MAG TPA: hypothetical protein PK252_03310 [Bacteroidales bacterium]|nr:hypothetical protein [Bacteroidales bacterium]